VLERELVWKSSTPIRSAMSSTNRTRAGSVRIRAEEHRNEVARDAEQVTGFGPLLHRGPAPMLLGASAGAGWSRARRAG
jgi:hypothetical protein